MRRASGLERGGEAVFPFQFDEIAAQGVQLGMQVVAREIVDFRFLAGGRAGQHGIGLPVRDPI